MKKGVLIGVVFVGILVGLLFASRYETTNKVAGKVIDKKGFVVIVEDEHGFVWKWNTEKNFVKDENVIILIDNKGTFKDREDDTVRKIVKG